MNKVYIILSSVLLALVVLSSSLFVVTQRDYAIVFQFGEAVRLAKKPGLDIRVPFIQDVAYFDNRLLKIEVEAKELTTADGKRVIIDAFARFNILDPIQVFKTVRNEHGAAIRLNKILEASMRKVIGRTVLTDLLSDKRSDIMEQIGSILNDEGKFLGVRVEDVRIMRTDLPKENSAAIYISMQSAREKEAKQIRAEGSEEAARITAEAEKDSQIILAKAYMHSEIIKGAGEASAAKIYNKAYSKDPEFYKFYKSLSTYRDALGAGDVSFILSPEGEFLKYLNLNK